MKRMLGVLAALAALGGMAEAAPSGSDVDAALVRCADVSYPAALTGCGTDPLTTGRLEVKSNGDVGVTLKGAAPGVAYDLVLHAANGSVQLPIAVVGTDATGNAAVRTTSFFDMGQAGIVAFTLGRNGSTQFVAGLHNSQELEAGLVPCAAINTPAALGGCGSDALKSGKVEFDEGDVQVDMTGDPDLDYAVVFRGLGGGDVPLGTLSTDKKGKGSLKAKDVVAEDVVGAGNVVLQRDGLDQFITGFASARKRPALVARFQVGLLRCAEVNTTAPFTGCGFDQLGKGDAIIDDKGDVNVHLMGAVPFGTYDVVFVGADGTTELPIGTLTTNPAGNGHLIARDVFPAGTRGVGHVIVKRDGLDQFVTGFAVSR